MTSLSYESERKELLLNTSATVINQTHYEIIVEKGYEAKIVGLHYSIIIFDK